MRRSRALPGLALALTFSACKQPPQLEIPAGLPVILVVCDSLRADHLGLYGYPRPTSPFLDRLAAERGWTYEKAYSHYSFTWPSIANLLTGIPHSELIRLGYFVPPMQPGQVPLVGGPTLGENLSEASVTSAAVFANPFLGAKYGYARGFSSFHDVTLGQVGKPTGELVNQAAFPLIEQLAAGDKPWFLYLHYFDTHMPYLPPAIDREGLVDSSYPVDGAVRGGHLVDTRDGLAISYRTALTEGLFSEQDIRHLVDLYDAEIRHQDRLLAELFQFLESTGLSDEVVVVISADHGESFFERGFWGHGSFSRAEEQWVPLLVIPPRGNYSTRRLTGVASTTDIFYTVSRHFGVAPQKAATQWWAHDLFTATPLRNAVYSQGIWGARIIRDHRYSFYRYLAGGTPTPGFTIPKGEFLFDTENDTGETRSILDSPQGEEIVRRLFAAAGLDADLHPVEADVDRLRKHLESLGYFSPR